ncbi:hypothetical protein BN13_1250006 [Nostocoides jenkinsii Ben 74]|uniref:Uncharacterized protein n=1 Tax=Nostocoides jenkinsii Ben 74 TaxID=1193518 RepID=A0A077M7L7_9MICO|nr:hypothetical protein BN13_1250006 [Tetrasphaera jenkinsii Ben 74]
MGTEAVTRAPAAPRATEPSGAFAMITTMSPDVPPISATAAHPFWNEPMLPPTSPGAGG